MTADPQELVASCQRCKGTGLDPEVGYYGWPCPICSGVVVPSLACRVVPAGMEATTARQVWQRAVTTWPVDFWLFGVCGDAFDDTRDVDGAAFCRWVAGRRISPQYYPAPNKAHWDWWDEEGNVCKETSKGAIPKPLWDGLGDRPHGGLPSSKEFGSSEEAFNALLASWHQTGWRPDLQPS